MKRVYLILTLFMTSFFLLSSNVSADVIELEVSETDFNFINDTFFTLREKVIELANSENKDYLITYSKTNSRYEIYLFEKDTNFFIIYESNSLRIKINNPVEIYKCTSNFLGTPGNKSSLILYFVSSTSSNILNYYNFLDVSRSDISYFGNAIKEYPDFIFNYNSISYEIKKDVKVPTLYEIYQDYQLSQVDPKAEIVTNFYVLIIDKIKLLTNYIVTDYIILSALVIFIFVAVIGLVRRLK